MHSEGEARHRSSLHRVISLQFTSGRLVDSSHVNRRKKSIEKEKERTELS